MKPALPVHHYHGDGIADHRGDDRCCDCGLPRRRECHDLPDTPGDLIEEEARRQGENVGEDE